MKKSQILAALALAFAMGLAVIPTASTFAESVNNADFGVITYENADSKLQDAITMGKNSCGWHLVGTDKTFYYDQYVALNTQLKASADAVEEEEENQYNGLKVVYTQVIADFQSVLTAAGLRLPSGVSTTFTDNVKTYSQAVTFIQNAITTLKNNATLYRNNANNTVYAGYQTAVNKLSDGTYTETETNTERGPEVADENEVEPGGEGYIPTYGPDVTTTTTVTKLGALKDAANGVNGVKTAQAALIEGKIILITGATADANISYADVLAKAAALRSTDNGVCTIALAANLKKAIDYAQNLLDSDDNFTIADVEKAIDNIKKAMNGGTVTNEDVKNPSTEGGKAPDTGILSNEDGGASTTVAMVAGVATALTAAGAGVVAYRNARRSSRK